ncbi:MAG TPA: hypothetical protein VKT99_01150 [Xanthobacteraceae bacterium]|nr:hypothetical protein [Xanthobacteraceae bacterium]
MTFTDAIPRSVMNRATRRAIDFPPPCLAWERGENTAARTILILRLGASIFSVWSDHGRRKSHR